MCMFCVGVYVGERVWSLCVCIYGCAGDSCNVRDLQVVLDIVLGKCYLLEVCKRGRSN